MNKILLVLFCLIPELALAADGDFSCSYDKKGKATVHIEYEGSNLIIDDFFEMVREFGDPELERESIEILLMSKFYQIRSCKDKTKTTSGKTTPVKGSTKSNNKKTVGYECTASGSIRYYLRNPGFALPWNKLLPRTRSFSATVKSSSLNKARADARKACLRKGLAKSASSLGSYHASGPSCTTSCKKV